MSNLAEVTAAWQAMQIKIDAAVGAASMEVALRLKGNAMRMIRGERPKGEKAVTGLPPMNRTGTLRNSISGTNSRLGFGIYAAIVGANTVYARAVEIGAPYNPPSWQNGEHFPFIQPTVDNFAKSGLVGRIVRKHIGAING